MLTLAFLVLIIVWAVARPSLTVHQESLACISCDTMKSNAITYIKQSDDGMCCGPAQGISQMLLHMETAAQYHYDTSGRSLIDIAKEYADCERETLDKHPIDKVVGIVEFKPSYTVEGHYKVLWNKNGRTFYSNNCVHLELEGDIYVRQSGYFIVSSQLNLRRRNERDTPVNETRPTPFIHHVDLLRDKYRTNDILMQTMKSIEGNGVYFTSFMSAVHTLSVHIAP